MVAVVIPPNQQLIDARNEALWSRERVALALNLPIYTVKALEEGRFQDLHGEAFVIGYMRAYAELFDLDARALIGQYKNSSKVDDIEGFNQPEMHASKLSAHFQHHKHRTGYGVAAAAVLVASLGIFSYQPKEEGSVEYSDAVQIETAAGTTVINSLDELPIENPTKDMLPGVVLEQKLTGSEVDMLLKQRILGEEQSESVLSAGKSLLNFQFSSDCWVEVLDGNNQLIYSSLQKAEDQLELSGKPPFQVTLGYAPGVVLSYNGKSVDINTDDANIAKLVLGNS